MSSTMDRSTKPSTPPPTDEPMNTRVTLPVADKLPTTPQKRGGNFVGNPLLTPPSTEKSGRTVRFAPDPSTPTRSRRHLLHAEEKDEATLFQYHELDSPVSFVDTSVSEDFWLGDEPSGLPLRAQTNQHVVPGNTEHEMLFQHTGIVSTCAPATPFPFMKLPLSVRKKIYECLLVVPGLICVRQNHTSCHNEENSHLYVKTRQLLPGIAYALPQVAVNGSKLPFSRFRFVNAAILRVSKQVFKEAKTIMYGANEFEIVCPNLETSPPPDYKIRLFPRGYQRYVQSLNIRVRALYPLKWLLNGGYGEIKRAYLGLDTFTIIFEMESGNKDLGKALSKMEDERWGTYVRRLHTKMTAELFGGNQNIKNLPNWLDIRVLFPGEIYSDHSEPTPYNIQGSLGPENADLTNAAEERLRRYRLKRGLAEVFERFKKGGR